MRGHAGSHRLAVAESSANSNRDHHLRHPAGLSSSMRLLTFLPVSYGRQEGRGLHKREGDRVLPRDDCRVERDCRHLCYVKLTDKADTFTVSPGN